MKDTTMSSPNLVEITGDMPYEERLFHHSTNIGSEELRLLTFRELQKLNIVRLQNEIAQIKRVAWKKTGLTAGQGERLTTLLHQYSNSPVINYCIYLRKELNLYLRIISKCDPGLRALP